MKDLLKRHIVPELLFRIEHFPVVALTGPRQAGKTTLARTLVPRLPKAPVYLDLELPTDLNKLRNAELFFRENQSRTIILDEVQRMPDLFPLIRSVVDQLREPGRFLILGSASPELLRQSSETLAGRISYLELPPFQFREIQPDQWRTHWLRGGFPPAFLAPTDRIAFQWLNDFLLTVIERDLPQFGLNAPSRQLYKLMLMLTGVHGNLLNYSSLSKSLGISSPTVKKYMQYLEHAYFLRFLLPWHTNVGKRLVKTPKVYYRDSGLFHSLAGIETMNALLGSQLAGASWEGYVVQQVLANLPAGVLPFFYRTKDGSELDLVLVKGNRPLLTIEVRFSDRPRPGKGNRLAMNDLKAPLNLLVAPAETDYPLDERLRVVGLNRLWPYLEGL